MNSELLEALNVLEKEKNISMLFICHDLALIRSFAHQIAVMYLGNIVEVIPGEDVTEYAVHPYTQALLGAQFSIHMDPSQKIQSIESEAPSPLDVPKGCPFQNRCEHCTDRCKAEMPKLKEIAPPGANCGLSPLNSGAKARFPGGSGAKMTTTAYSPSPGRSPEPATWCSARAPSLSETVHCGYTPPMRFACA